MSLSARGMTCATVIEDVERVNPSTYLVRTYCKGRKPERETLVFQLIDIMPRSGKSRFVGEPVE